MDAERPASAFPRGARELQKSTKAWLKGALASPCERFEPIYVFFSGAEPGPASKPEGSDISRSSKSIAPSSGFMPGSFIL